MVKDLTRTGPQSQREPGKARAPRAFLHLADLLAHHGRTASGRDAILTPDGARVSYGELRVLVAAAARRLRTLGVRRTDRVAVVLPSGPEAAVAIVAVATAAVCVPLNPGFTAAEWQRYLADFRIAALLTRADIGSPSRSVAHALGILVIDLSPRPDQGPCAFDLLGAVARRIVDDDVAPAADHDAFMLLTSGSTSQPKLVPLTHAGVCLSARNVGSSVALLARDRLLNVLPLYHAHGLFSGLLAALAAGSSVVCTRGFDPDAFFDWLSVFRPSWYTAVPAIHRALLGAADRHRHAIRQCSLRVIRSASAPLPPALQRELESLFGVPVVDTYGMTEAASQIAANPLERRKPGSVGRSAGAEIAIMDRNGRRLAAGERGEIALRGPTITRGYDNDVDATAAAFRDGWFRTGDLGYLDRDGYLFIVGRIKEVIKRGGQQVAPAEVEAALAGHPDVLEAAVFPIAHARLGEDVAAAVVVRPHAAVAAQALRNFLRKRLAGFKVPGVIRIVPEIPKNAGGKVRRGDLAARLSIATPDQRSKGDGGMLAPRSDLELQLAGIWADLLHQDRIGREQDVFALGADSLTLTQVLSRLRTRFGVDFSFNDVFDAPTIAALAARIESSAVRPAVRSPSVQATTLGSGDVPLSFQQQRIDLLSRLDPVGYNYHVFEVFRLVGPLDVDALEASIAAICERHEVLRSTFPAGSGEPLQVVGEQRPALERLDMRGCARGGRLEAIRRRTRELLHRGMNCETTPPLHASLLRFDARDHALVVRIHHLATDGWSQRLFWEELAAHYSARLRKHPPALPALPIHYRHFVEWQRAWLETPTAGEQLRYWLAQLDGLTELPLHTDRPRPGIWTGRGARHSLQFPSALSRGLKSLGRAHGVTLYMTLLAAFQCLLHRYTGHDDVAVGSLIANRNQIELERLIGMFANTIVLRVDLSCDPTFGEVLRRVRQVTLDAYRNQDMPIERIMQGMQVSRGIDRGTLFQVMFTLQSAPLKAPALPGLSARHVELDPGIARFDLTLELIDAGAHLEGWLEYSTDLFEPATVARMAAHLQTLLAAIVVAPGERISRLALLPAAERRQVLFDWSDTDIGLGRPGTFSGRFVRQAGRTPDAVAVSIGQVRLSYRELARRGRVIAERLVAEGVGPDVLLILLAERNVDFLAALIAVQSAGGAFLPLDPRAPVARLAQVMRHSRAPLVLAGESCAAVVRDVLSEIPARLRPRVRALQGLYRAAPRNAAAPARPAPSSLAYVIYTSGSTGVPKGAMVEQRGFLNHLLSLISDLALSAADVVAQTAPQHYVISVWQFLAPLLVGAHVHICADEEVRDPAELAGVIEREGVTVLQIVPALLRAIVERAPAEPGLRAFARLRLLIATGEALAPDLCRDWFRCFPQVPLINAYGSVECSDDVATHRMSEPPPSGAAVPIGRPMANRRLYVLDAHLQPVPIGVAGVLCVGGIGVGRGYLNDPDLTRRSFLRDPFSKRRAARMYRTGDLARWRADGILEFVGRTDHQVKVRGYRVELSEIEYALMEHPDIKTAVVLARADRAGDLQLVAHVVAVAGRQPAVAALRDFLRARLPRYMFPAGFVFLERVPLTANGKVDRRALLAICPELRVAAGELVAPRDSTEQVLAGIWASMLEVSEVGVLDNFFDLGGHSLLAGRVLSRVASAFGISMPIRALFEAPTVEALARRIREAREQPASEPVPAIGGVDDEQRPSVSIFQEDVLRLERDLPGLPQFNLPIAWRLKGPLDARALERSLREVVRRHELLRTGFAWIGEEPVAVVAPAAGIDCSLVVEDMAGRRVVDGERAQVLLSRKAELLAEQEACRPFDLTRAPLLRARLLRLGASDHVLLLVLHHVIFDGWSIGVFLEEISEFYAAYATGRQPQLREPALRHSEFARWQRNWCTTDPAIRQLAYWKDGLREAAPIFPTDSDIERGLLASPIAYEPIHVPEDLVARLRAVSHAQGATVFMTLLAGFKTLLLARTRRSDICVATAMAGRSHPGTERMIGPLVNTTLIRTRLDPDLSFAEGLARVRDAVLEGHARQELPFDILAARLADEAGLDPASLIQVFFLLQNPFGGRLELADVTVRPFGNAYRQGQPVLPIDRTWLWVMLKETDQGIVGSCTYKTDLFEASVLQQWIADYQRILARAVRNPGTSLGDLVD